MSTKKGVKKGMSKLPPSRFVQFLLVLMVSWCFLRLPVRAHSVAYVSLW
jgi:hypothetical protein